MFNVEGDKHRAGELVQLTLDQARKGLKGGLALRDKYGNAYMRTIASKGGKRTLERYGIEHMRRIGAAGAKALIKKLDNDPRTVKYWDGTRRRIVPYKPPKSRKQRPIMVQIMIDDIEGVNV